MKVDIKSFKELTNFELYEILKIRSEIFVVEQNCIYNDPDGKDRDATHMIIREKNEIVGYIRLLKRGVSYIDSPSIGRVLVAKNARGKGIARNLMVVGIDYIIKNWNEKHITIGAQEYLKEFYKSLGFVGISDVYDDEGIPHLDMKYRKNY